MSLAEVLEATHGRLLSGPAAAVFERLVICLVPGLGTLIVVLLGLVTAGSEQTTGEPSGAILAARIPAVHLLATLFG